MLDVNQHETQVAAIPSAKDVAKPWVDIFGIYQPDSPTQVTTEQAPAVVNHNYLLKGLFASADSSWAIVADPTGEYLLRAGDELPGGALVSDINEEGVWLMTSQGRELIAFGE